jgi:hypothetical protein
MLEDKFKYFLEKINYVEYETGTDCGSKNRVTIFVAGLWAVLCFVLANSYRSRLISFLTSSSQEPLLDSIYDLPNKPNVHLVVEEGTGMDIMFSV